MSGSGLQGGVVKIMHSTRTTVSVALTNQCLGKEMNAAWNAEPPGRGTEESFLMDSDKLVGIWEPLSGKLI
jgi:hypothetical protein